MGWVVRLFDLKRWSLKVFKLLHLLCIHMPHLTLLCQRYRLSYATFCIYPHRLVCLVSGACPVIYCNNSIIRHYTSRTTAEIVTIRIMINNGLHYIYRSAMYVLILYSR